MHVLYDTIGKTIVTTGDLHDTIRSAIRHSSFGEIPKGMGQVEAISARLDRLEAFIVTLTSGLTLVQLNGILKSFGLVLYKDVLEEDL